MEIVDEFVQNFWVWRYLSHLQEEFHQRQLVCHRHLVVGPGQIELPEIRSVPVLIDESRLLDLCEFG